jgi:hypothetical protein
MITLPVPPGNFKFSFQGETIEFNADASLVGDAQCREQIERLTNIDSVVRASIPALRASRPTPPRASRPAPPRRAE